MRDDADGLWAGRYAMTFLKAPELYDRGLRLKAYVPEELAELKPNLYLRGNGKALAKKALDTAGEIDIRADIRDVDDALTDYLSDVRDLQMKLLSESDITRPSGCRQ